MKKILLIGTLALASTASLADSLFRGAYVGVGAGANIAHYTKNRLSFIGTGALVALSQNFNANLNKYAPTFNLLVGYAWKLQGWHFGAEIDYLFGDINTKFTQTGLPNFAPFANNSFVSIKSSGAWGAAARVGYHWDRVLGFIRLGLENRQFKINANALAAGDSTQIARNTLYASINRTAFSPGIGVQVGINKNMSATLEYRIALYRTIKQEFKTIEGTTSLKIDPRVSTFLASFRYHF